MENIPQDNNNTNQPIPDIITSSAPPTAPEPASDDIGGATPSRTTPILIVIAIVALIASGTLIFFILYDPPHIFNRFENYPLSASEIINLRQNMSDEAIDLAKRSAPGSEFIATMNSHIASARTENAKRSLEIYLVYLSTRHNFSGEAIDAYDEFMKEKDSLTPVELCELSEYRIMASNNILTNHDNLSALESQRDTACAEALSQEAYTQEEDESDFDYSVRLFYSGIMTEAISRLKSIDGSTLTAEERALGNDLIGEYDFSTSYHEGDSEESTCSIEEGNCNTEILHEN